MKKLTALLTAIVIVAGLTACGDKDERNSVKNSKSTRESISIDNSNSVDVHSSNSSEVEESSEIINDDSSDTPDTSEETVKPEIVQVDAYGNNIGILTSDGRMYILGSNVYGQLGNGSYSESWIAYNVLSDISEISVSSAPLAVSNSNDLYKWGSTEDRNVTEPEIKINGVKSACSKYNNGAYITTVGELFTYGDNNFGQLGNGERIDNLIGGKNKHESIEDASFIMNNVKKVDIGDGFMGALTEDGDLYTWGWNDYGRTGLDTEEDEVLIPELALSGVRDFSLGHENAAVILNNGDLYIWGSNQYGQKGIGDSDARGAQLVMPNVKTVDWGETYVACVTEKGDLYIWGGDEDDRLNHGEVLFQTTPKKVMSGVKDVAVGNQYVCVILDDNTIYKTSKKTDGKIENCTEIVLE